MQEALPACPLGSHCGKGRLSRFIESRIRKDSEAKTYAAKELPYIRLVLPVQPLYPGEQT